VPPVGAAVGALWMSCRLGGPMGRAVAGWGQEVPPWYPLLVSADSLALLQLSLFPSAILRCTPSAC